MITDPEFYNLFCEVFTEHLIWKLNMKLSSGDLIVVSDEEAGHHLLEQLNKVGITITDNMSGELQILLDQRKTIETLIDLNK